MANERLLNHTQGEEIIAALNGIKRAVADDFTLQTKTAAPSQSQQVIEPDLNYDGLSRVTVAAIPSPYYDTSQVDAAAGDVLSGKKIVDANGNVLTGTLVEKTLGTRSITQNGTYQASADGVDGYSEVVVNVSGGGGGSIIYSEDDPTPDQGSDGDTFVKFEYVSESIAVEESVTGGYNGGAAIIIKFDGTRVFTARASDTYNMNYDNTSASISTDIGTVDILVTPPASSTGLLVISITSPNDVKTNSISPAGSNTSYGYNFSDSFSLAGETGDDREISAILIKANSVWKGAGDIL